MFWRTLLPPYQGIRVYSNNFSTKVHGIASQATVILIHFQILYTKLVFPSTFFIFTPCLLVYSNLIFYKIFFLPFSPNEGKWFVCEAPAFLRIWQSNGLWTFSSSTDGLNTCVKSFVRPRKVTWKKQGHTFIPAHCHHTLKTEGIRGSLLRQNLLLLKLSANQCSTLNKPFSQTDNMVRKYRDRPWVKWQFRYFKEVWHSVKEEAQMGRPAVACNEENTAFV